MRAARACLLNTGNMASRNTASLRVAISQNELAEVAKVMGFRSMTSFMQLCELHVSTVLHFKVAVPSTVDNDLAMVDTSFGFDTACTEAGCSGRQQTK